MWKRALGAGAVGAVATSAIVGQIYRQWQEQGLALLHERSHLVNTPNGMLEYELVGEGATVMVVHGSPGGFDQGLLLSSILGEGLSLLSPSRPGYLRTPLSTGENFLEQADALAGLLNTLGIERVAPLGLMTGAPIALQFALRHPDRVWSLAIISGVSSAWTLPHVPELIFNALGWGAELFPAPFLRGLLSEISDYDEEMRESIALEILRDPRKVKQIQDYMLTFAPFGYRRRGYANDVRQLAEMPRYPLEDIDVPTLVLHSRVDRIVPLSHAKLLENMIAKTQLIEMEGAGHWFWLDESHVGEQLRAFFVAQK